MPEKCPNAEFFLVHIFPHSDWILRDIKSECGKIQTRKNSVFGHFSRSVFHLWFFVILAEYDIWACICIIYKQQWAEYMQFKSRLVILMSTFLWFYQNCFMPISNSPKNCLAILQVFQENCSNYQTIFILFILIFKYSSA